MFLVRRSTRLIGSNNDKDQDQTFADEFNENECTSWHKVPGLKKRNSMMATKRSVNTMTTKRAELKENNATTEKEVKRDTESTPPKQKKISDDELFSPSRCLTRLHIKPHSSEEDEPKTDKVVDRRQRTKFESARKVLNSAETTELLGRESELKTLAEFLENHLENSTSGSLYVSGQPGTGKTACLSHLLNSAEFDKKLTKVYINCTSISTIGSIYKKICSRLKIKVQGTTEKHHLSAIEQYLIKNHKMTLLVLDEIDQLVGNKQSVLYTIFEWPSKINSNLILIGIANSLDLTDRLLVRLTARVNMKPVLMHFYPYTKQQIVEIIKSRLEKADVLDVFPPATIQLLAGKVAAVNGDIRRALDIARRVTEVAQQQKLEGKRLNLKDLGIDGIAPLKETQPVQMKQVVDVLNTVYGISQNLDDDIVCSFPLQQKILLCSLLLMLRKEKNKDITIGRLHDVYKRVCNKKNIQGLDQAEFVGLCSLVETRGIIRLVGKKEPRLIKITLQWDQTEVHNALKDKQLIASILDDTTCLGK